MSFVQSTSRNPIFNIFAVSLHPKTLFFLKQLFPLKFSKIVLYDTHANDLNSSGLLFSAFCINYRYHRHHHHCNKINEMT